MTKSVVVLLLGATTLLGCPHKTTSSTGSNVTTAAPPPTATDPNGSVKAVVVFTGTPPAMQPINTGADAYCGGMKPHSESVLVNSNKTLKNVLVRLATVPGTFAAPSTPAAITQQGCAYHPHVQGVVAGQTIQIKNADQTLHNIHTFKGTESMFNMAQPKGAAPIVKELPAPSLITFRCDVHPWMAGYVVVTAHPFFGVTGDDGSVEIKGIAPGTYTVEAWHEKGGTRTASVTVAAGKSVDVKFSYDAADVSGP